MTPETMTAVAEKLRARDLEATLEYPGVISIRCKTFPCSLVIGDANDTIDADLCDDEFNVVSSHNSTLPNDCADVDAIASWVVSISQ